jgi:hypothetical protein
MVWKTAALQEDCIAVVQARKKHWGHTSRVQMQATAVLLVRPNPQVALELTIPVSGARFGSTVGVAGGDPGIFYALRRGSTGAERLPPAYFHQINARAPRYNKGIGLLRVEGDLALTRTPPEAAGGDEVALSERRPLDPVLDIGELPYDVDLHVRARKARSGVSVDLAKVAHVAAPPEVEVETNPVAAGAQARVVISQSRPEQRYELRLNGEAVKRARNGNGEDLAIITEAVNEETHFELWITSRDDAHLTVSQVVPLTVTVQ